MGPREMGKQLKAWDLQPRETEIMPQHTSNEPGVPGMVEPSSKGEDSWALLTSNPAEKALAP